MTDRIDRHRTMAEQRIRGHQAMTEAHVQGRTPVSPERDIGRIIYFTPQSGERVVEGDSIFGKNGALHELEMYWKEIPDFGIKSFEIFATETGWAQTLHWNGTTRSGEFVRGEEADVYKTDEDFNIVRVEYYCDAKQWHRLAALAAGEDPETFDERRYFELAGAG